MTDETRKLHIAKVQYGEQGEPTVLLSDGSELTKLIKVSVDGHLSMGTHFFSGTIEFIGGEEPGPVAMKPPRWRATLGAIVAVYDAVQGAIDEEGCGAVFGDARAQTGFDWKEWVDAAF